jgi:putative ABC transport system permease protein
MDQLEGLGTNLVQISITGRNSNRNVTYDDLVKIQEEHTDKIKAIAPMVSGNMTAKYGTESESTSLIGSTPEYESIRNVHVQSGRFITQIDVDYSSRVALVGTALVNQLYGGVDPIGKTIKLNGELFNIIGVLEERASSQDSTDDDQVIIPVTVAARLTKSTVIRNFMVQATTPEATNEVTELFNTYLLKIYRDSRTFRVFNMTQMLSALDSVTGVLMLVLGGIAAISLIVGGVGIMNIMLVSVTERTREIGIRKAIGAKKGNIMTQFLIEALVVTGLGGVIGVLIGLALIKFVIGGLKIVPEVYSLDWILISFGFSLAIGVIFGLYPARKAANLNPIDALMYE